MSIRNKIKSFLLGIVVSGLFGSAFAADVPAQYNFYPLYFEYLTKNDSAVQKAEWDYLMKYKIFGAKGIDFLGSNINIPDKVGWFGTAEGAWTLSNDKHRVGGPILIGGNVSFNTGLDSILTGPFRVTGGILANQDFYSKNNFINGNVCIANNVDARFAKFVKDGYMYIGSTDYPNCPSGGPDSVPQVKTNLRVPVIADSEKPQLIDNGIVFSNNGGMIPQKSIYIDDMIGYIDVPKSGKATASEREGDTYDLRVKEMHLKNNSHLIVRMPSGGRLTRIFIDDVFEVTSHPHIQVQYMDESATYNEATHSWSGNSKTVDNDKYMGNLLFYAQCDMRWPALVATDSIQGTFISTGRIHVEQQMTLAGQLLADKIEINANFDGSGYIFVPWNPSNIDPGALAQGEYVENDSLVAIDVKLDKVPSTNVTFNYCFKFGSGGTTRWASKDDLMILDNDMPLCKDNDLGIAGKKDSARIYAGELSPTDSVNKAWIRVKKDGIVEKTEWLYFCISDLQGAVIKDSSGLYDAQDSSGQCLPIRLKDADNNPPELDDNNSLKVYENVLGDTAGTIVGKDKDAETLTYSIMGGSGKDLFVINQDGVLALKPDTFVDYETTKSYTVLIGVSDGRVQSPVTKSFTVNVIDVNEKPIANDFVINVNENTTPGTEIGIYTWNDPDMVSKFTDNDISIAVGGDTDLFEISKEGSIIVKDGAVLDYEVSTVHHLNVKVYDSLEVTLYDEAVITINLKDEDDGPKIVIIPDGDPKNDPKTHKLVLNNKGKQGTEENNKANALAGAVQATCTAIDCMKNLTFTMFEDTSGLFAMDSKTGEITVTNSKVLDYEKVNEYAVKVYVCDNNPKGAEYNQYDSATVYIRVIDVDEMPSLKDGILDVDEQEPAGTVAGKMDSLTTDLDTAKNFIKHRYNGIAGDTSVFKVNKDGSITTRSVLDYGKASSYTVVVEVVDEADSSLRDTATMSIKVNNKNDDPYFTSTDTYKIPENPAKDFVIGTLTAADEDVNDSVFTFKLKSNVDFVTVSEGGVIKVKDSTAFDFEKTHELTFEVTVFDEHGGSSDTLITISITDVNEPVTLPPQTFTVREDSDTGVVIGKIVANDLDTAKAFTHHTFKLVGRSVGFEVDSNGTIILRDSLDYETDSIYILKVAVTDGEFCDTNDITIIVKDVVERSTVIITRGETPDSVWLMPDTIYTNRNIIDLEWEEDGVKRFGSEPLKDGKNVIIKTYKDPSKNYGGADTVIVYFNSANPEVIVSTKSGTVDADNIYTVVQEKEEGDSSYYVNKKDNDIFVSVKDPGSSKVDTFTVGLKLDTLNISSSTFTKTMKKISESKLSLDRNSTSEKTTTQLNGDSYATSYKEIVNGNEVTVTYYTDFKGNLVKGESGKKEIKVSYSMVVDGKNVIVSYKADASTGELIEGRNGAAYTVAYDYVDSVGNSINVAYGVNEDGAFVVDDEGNAGYDVSYSFTNKYGNTATKSLYIVIDKAPPKVEILYPADGDVIYSNFVDVKWSVDGVVQDTLVTQGLQKGTQGIVRFYKDKAGNIGKASIVVVVKNTKDVEISVEKPVTMIDEERAAQYYKSNPPKKNESFAVTLFSESDQVEKEILIGGDMKTKAGSGKEPYPGLKGHLGPTLKIDAKLPTVNELGGLATLDDLVGKDGLVKVDGVDAANSEKLPMAEYVSKYCSAEFSNSLPSDLGKANLYATTMNVTIWIYTNLGQFVDKISYAIDLNDPDYANDAGKIAMFVELKPDLEGFVHTKDGKLLATGAYVYKTEVNMHSTLRCDLPPVHDKSNTTSKIGAKRKVSEDLLKSFGYRRPDNKY